MNPVRAACVIGWPAAHSRSPLIHRYWLKARGIAGDYRAEAVPPEAFAGFIKDLAARGYVGANVTIPHKETALALSRPDDRASAVGAANTLWLDGGVLRSTNTDVEGFLANLDDAAPGWHRDLDDVLVLGAGGSARAVVFALRERRAGCIHIVNRTAARGEELRERFGTAVHPAAWQDVAALAPRARLVVNTTSLGMAGQPALPFDVPVLRADCVVADLVYVPLRTALLEAARARGLRTADGLGMLLHQAVRGFSLWFGITPQVTGELRALVEADLAQTGIIR
jgi:shikimate dehydrogenase